MAADTTTLTEKMRAALRISSTSEKITEEINDCIAACKMDLQDVGVKKLDETDALIIRAITLYCKAEFGYSDKSEQFLEVLRVFENSFKPIQRIHRRRNAGQYRRRGKRGRY